MVLIHMHPKLKLKEMMLLHQLKKSLLELGSIIKNMALENKIILVLETIMEIGNAGKNTAKA